MLVKLDLESEIPIYQQLKDQIVMGIAMNDLEPGESLPSVRELASDLGVNLHTIRKSYNQLKTEGFVHVNRRKGAVVAKLPIALDDEQRLLVDNGLETYIATLVCSGRSHEEIRLKIDSILNRMIERK